MGSLRRILLAAAVLLPGIAFLAIRANAQATPAQLHRPGSIHEARLHMRAPAKHGVPRRHGVAERHDLRDLVGKLPVSVRFPRKIRRFQGLDAILAIADQYMLGEKAHTILAATSSTTPLRRLGPIPIILGGNDIIIASYRCPEQTGDETGPHRFTRSTASSFP
jgi:hypothetical protein